MENIIQNIIQNIQYLTYAIYCACFIIFIQGIDTFLLQMRVRRLEKTQKENIEDFHEDEETDI